MNDLEVHNEDVENLMTDYLKVFYYQIIYNCCQFKYVESWKRRKME